MYDRRIEGRTLTFGNQGALYMNVMVWYDRQTRSLWSQPWGKAIFGELDGTVLKQIPAEVVPWRTWRQAHPQTLAMVTAYQLAARGIETFDENAVIGVVIGQDARAYPYRVAAEERVINDQLGAFPLLVYADPDTQASHVYLRTVGENVLTFELRAGALYDRETGTRWSPERGLAQEGALAGEVLRVVPHTSAYAWAWEDFYGSDSYQAPPAPR